MAEEKTSTKKRNTRRKRTSTKQQTKSQGFSLRSEVKGLIVIAFAVIPCSDSLALNSVL